MNAVSDADVIILAVPYAAAAGLPNFGILLAFAVVCGSVVVLRYRSPELERGFRCPGMPVIPLIGVASSIWLTTYLAQLTWERFAIWFLIGLAVSTTAATLFF